MLEETRRIAMRLEKMIGRRGAQKRIGNGTSNGPKMDGKTTAEKAMPEKET